MSRVRSRSGFTLIEAVASIVILAVGIPPMLWAIADAHMKRANPVLASRARWLATEKLEDIIADRHSTTRGYAYVVPANYPAEPAVSGLPAYARSVAISETEADLVTAGTGYKTVTVDIDWNDATGAARTLSVATVLTDYIP